MFLKLFNFRNKKKIEKQNSYNCMDIKDSNKTYCEEYDSNGNLIYHKGYSGFEYWKEYDSNNNLIHYKDSNGYEYCEEYDSNGNLIYHKDYSGFEYWKEYDENNNLIHCKDSVGNEEWYEYDKYNNLIHYRDLDNDEEFYLYNENGVITYKKIIKSNISITYKYDFTGNKVLMRKVSCNNFEYLNTYDDKGRLISHKDSNEIIFWPSYDD